MAELITQRIQRNAAELRLHAIAENPDELIERAEQAELGYREFLDLLLESEVGVLEGRRYQARLKMAGLPHHKTQDPGRVRHSPSSPIWTPSASRSCARCGSSSARLGP